MAVVARQCSLHLREIMTVGDAPQSLLVHGSGPAVRISRRDDPRRGCDGLELLRELLRADAAPARAGSTSRGAVGGTSSDAPGARGPADAHASSSGDGDACALQQELLALATRLGASSSSAGAFSVVQDCAAPPCCPELLPEFARQQPDVTVFAARGAARGGDMPPDNLWLLRPLAEAGGINSTELLGQRRVGLLACDGGCVRRTRVAQTSPITRPCTAPHTSHLAHAPPASHLAHAPPASHLAHAPPASHLAHARPASHLARSNPRLASRALSTPPSAH